MEDLDRMVLTVVFSLAGVVLLIALISWILYGISHSRILKLMNYPSPWMAWLPYANYYALADCIKSQTVNIFGVQVHRNKFKLWWALKMLLNFIPEFGWILGFILEIACLGLCYAEIYSYTDNKPKEDVIILGYVSGFVQLIPTFKYLIEYKGGKRNDKC